MTELENTGTYSQTTVSIGKTSNGSFVVLMRVDSIPSYEEAKAIVETIRAFLDDVTEPGSMQ